MDPPVAWLQSRVHGHMTLPPKALGVTWIRVKLVCREQNAYTLCMRPSFSIGIHTFAKLSTLVYSICIAPNLT